MMEHLLNILVPDESPASSQLTPVATLAFFDLETTGLPCDVGRSNVQITELSIVAVDRSDFENDASLRVAHKLNICVRPRSSISFGAMSVTGLYNDILEKQKPFDNTIPQLISLFFSRLRSPVCLLAHNGKAFDFPILQAEIKRLNVSLPADVTCADTLEAFRTLDLVSPNNRESLSSTKVDIAHIGSPNTKLIDVPSDREIDEALSDNIEHFRYLECDAFDTNSSLLRSILNHGALPVDYGNKTPDKETSRDCPQLPHHSVKITEHTRNLPLTKRKLFTTDDVSKKLKVQNQSDVTVENISPSNSKKPINRKKNLSLEKLYEHYFGEKPKDSHHALSDCMNLCKVCQKINESFLSWLDEKQVLFSEVTAMW